MTFNFNIIPATIKALTKFVEVLDRHPRGAARLVQVIAASIVLVVVYHLPTLVSSAPAVV